MVYNWKSFLESLIVYSQIVDLREVVSIEKLLMQITNEFTGHPWCEYLFAGILKPTVLNLAPSRKFLFKHRFKCENHNSFRRASKSSLLLYSFSGSIKELASSGLIFFGGLQEEIDAGRGYS
jgi:hypothetical protein